MLPEGFISKQEMLSHAIIDSRISGSFSHLHTPHAHAVVHASTGIYQ